MSIVFCNVGAMKKCSKCKKTKSVKEFYTRRRGGFQSRCRLCEKEYNKEYQKNNRESIRKRGTRYRKNNKKSICKYQKKYHENNRESIRKYDNERIKQLGDAYIRKQLFDSYVRSNVAHIMNSFTRLMIPQELVDAKRMQLKIIRFIKSMKGEKHEKKQLAKNN